MAGRRALVIGGSVGGLMAASLLRKGGWDVVIFERAQGDLAGRGAGLGLSAELFAVLRRIGARVTAGTGITLPAIVWLDASGAVLHEDRRGWVTGAWPRIYRPLREAVPDAIYRPGRALERIEPDGRGVTAIFADGARETGDLVIAADGVASTVRGQFLPGLAPSYAGYVAWRGIVEESDIAAHDREQLFGAISFCAPPGELILAMPSPGAGEDTRPGHRRFYFIWYRPADAARMAELCTDASGRNHGFSIPPPLIRRAVTDAVKADAAALLPPRVAAVVRQTAQLLLQPIVDLEVPRMVWGRAALLGDAAFIARPHVAAGITKAALDAAGLADALAETDDIDAALARYARERLAWGRALVEYSRYLGGFIGAPDGSAARRDPATYLREYGAPHLIHDPLPGDVPPR
ncbi:MAG TPA: FAD-dependent monooxygenase [Stellaceae bacterium]|nr:FAD-dependent monooxygenase [Stellaceae bacterium]